MEIILDCLPCMLGQVLEASRMATDDTSVQEKILIEATGIISNYKRYGCSPELALAMHQTVKKHSKKLDPYDIINAKRLLYALFQMPCLRPWAIISQPRCGYDIM